MYTNNPTHELLSIIDTARNNNLVEESLKRDIINLSKTIINQHYLQFEDMTYRQHKELAMGAPTSSIFSAFYLQYQENSRIYDLLRSHNIAGYFRYVADILIVYNGSTTYIEDHLHCFNSLTPIHTIFQQTGTHLRKNTVGQIHLLRQGNKGHYKSLQE